MDSNYIHDKVWDDITYPFWNFNSEAIDFWEYISNFIPHFTWHVNSYPYYNQHYTMLGKGALINNMLFRIINNQRNCV